MRATQLPLFPCPDCAGSPCCCEIPEEVLRLPPGERRMVETLYHPAFADVPACTTTSVQRYVWREWGG